MKVWAFELLLNRHVSSVEQIKIFGNFWIFLEKRRERKITSVAQFRRSRTEDERERWWAVKREERKEGRGKREREKQRKREGGKKGADISACLFWRARWVPPTPVYYTYFYTEYFNNATCESM